MTQSTNFFDNPSFNNFYFESNFPMVELNFERENIKPTKEMKTAVVNALDDKRPYKKLIEVFDTFGYLLSQELILGQKLYRSCNIREKTDLFSKQLEIEKNYSSELFDLWEDYVDYVEFDEKYLMSINGEAVRKTDIEKWLNKHLKQDFKLLRIIYRSKLLPLYEIFDEPISRQIKSVLGIDNLPKILMTGIIQIYENIKYYNVDFPFHLGSCNYHIFAKVTKSNKESFDVIDKTIVRIRSGNHTGFFAIIENFDEINDINPEDLQIMWILVGFPDEINFYSLYTRELSILSMENQDIDNGKTSVLVDVPENLPENSRIVVSFEYPLSSDYLITKNNKIELKIDSNLYDDTYLEGMDLKPDNGPENESEADEVESGSESDEVGSGFGIESEFSSIDTEYKIIFPFYSYIFTFNKEFIEADISTSKYKFIYLKAIGSLIS
ncbi:13808_t:CDS:2 [Cetraspora pellucida]|uniref:13808_t:CDS:1 n=1 Tax=Cetraspora pellucida TaxID=1433469 RepID=A0ACA9P4H2_9GLOM|nr:13808_t:CDS:2 [Cetraspora pellucida]